MRKRSSHIQSTIYIHIVSRTVCVYETTKERKMGGIINTLTAINNHGPEIIEDAWPKANETMDSIIKAADNASHLMSTLQPRVERAIDAVSNAADNFSDFFATTQPHLESTLNNLTNVVQETVNKMNQKLDELSVVVTNINETLGTVHQILTHVNNTLVSVTPTVRFVIWLIFICLALLVLLIITKKTKNLIMSGNRNMVTTTSNARRSSSTNAIEMIVLELVYSIFLLITLTLVMTGFLPLFQQLPDICQFKWISDSEASPKHFIPLTICMVFVFIQQQGAVLVCLRSIKSNSWYMLLELPVRLILDPYYRGMGYVSITSSYCKCCFYKVVNLLLYIAVAVIYTYIIYTWSYSSQSILTVIGLMYCLFYVMALVVCALGKALTWILVKCGCYTRRNHDHKENSHVHVNTTRKTSMHFFVQSYSR